MYTCTRVPGPRVARARVGDQGPSGQAVSGQEARLVVRTLPVIPPEHRHGVLLRPLQPHGVRPNNVTIRIHVRHLSSQKMRLIKKTMNNLLPGKTITLIFRYCEITPNIIARKRKIQIFLKVTSEYCIICKRRIGIPKNHES